MFRPYVYKKVKSKIDWSQYFLLCPMCKNNTFEQKSGKCRTCKYLKV